MSGQVVPFPSALNAAHGYVVERVGLEDFCIADEKREWTSRTVVGGSTILLFPGVAIINDSAGSSFVIRYRTTETTSIFDDQLQALCAIA